MQRLQRQADAQVAAVAFEDADMAADDVVQNLVAAAVKDRIDHRGVVLHVDPVRYHHRRGHDQFEDLTAIATPVVIVQEGASAEVDVATARARRDDEGRVAGQSPLRASLGPVVGALAQGAQQAVTVGRCVEAQCMRAFGSRARAGRAERIGQAAHEWRLRPDVGLAFEQFDFVSRGVVQSGDEYGVGRNLQAAPRQGRTHGRVIEQVGEDARVEVAGLTAAGTAVESGSVRVVGALTAVADQGDDARLDPGQAHGAQHGLGQVRALLRSIGSRDDQPGTQCRALIRGQACVGHGAACRGRRQTASNQPERVADAEGLDQAERGCRQLPGRSPAGACPQALPAAMTQVVGVAAGGRLLGDLERRRQQAGQARLVQSGADRRVGDRQAEEAGEAGRTQVRRDRFEGTPEHLGTYVDAEHRQYLAGGLVTTRAGSGQRSTQALLVGDLERALAGPRKAASGWLGIASLPGLAPVCPGRIILAATVIEQALPGQADRQEFLHAGVVAAAQPGLPAPVGAPGRPAVDAQQNEPQEVLEFVIRNSERIDRLADHGARIGCQRRHPGLALRQVHEQVDAAIGGDSPKPVGVEAVPGRHRPVGFTGVEPGRAELADLLGDEVGPGWLVAQVSALVETVAEQRQRRAAIGRQVRRLECRDDRCAFIGAVMFGQGRAQVRGVEAPLAPGVTEVSERHLQSTSDQTLLVGVDLGERPFDLLPVRADRDETIQRPGRCDRPTGRFDGRLDRRGARGVSVPG